MDRINDIVQALKEDGVDIGEVSDGYHTFNELYEHRYKLFIALCNATDEKTWKARRNADGTEWPGWFILGINPEEGKQITYHLPMQYWDVTVDEVHDINPYFDGHTSKEVLNRLK